MQTASMLKPPDRGNSPKKKCSHVTVSLVAIALCLLVGPAQHAEGVPYYRFMDATATAAKGGGKPNIAKPFALDLHPLNIAALNNAPANAAIQPSSHYYYDSNLAGAARVVGGLGAGANNPCNIHWAARPPMYGGRRHTDPKRHVFEIDDTAAYWAGLGLDAQVDNNPTPGHATIFINDAAADVKGAGGGKTPAYANGQFQASAAHWGPKLAALPGPCRQANELWIAAPANAAGLQPQIGLPANNQDPTNVAGAYQGYGGINVLVEDPCALGAAALPAAYGGVSANHVWSLPAGTLPAIVAKLPARYGVWQYAANNNILYPIFRDITAQHDPHIQALGWVKQAACVGHACCV